MLFVICCSLFSVRRDSTVVRRVLHVVCLLSVVCCRSLFDRWLLFAVRCLLILVCCVLLAGWCLVLCV